MKRPIALLAGIALAVPIALTAGAASAAPTPPPEQPIAEGLAGPLKLALVLDGSIYVTQSFAGQLTKIDRKGTQTTLYAASTPPESTDVGGVSAFLGNVYFTETIYSAQGQFPQAYLKKVDKNGKVSTLADIAKHEDLTNPDGQVQYGFVGLDQTTCPVAEGLRPHYDGIKDSHPYATIGTPVGTVVADAAANALFTVDVKGKVRTLAVLPPQPYVVTEAGAEAAGFPVCTVGLTYNYEPVPTDVELGPDGWLYVSLLPGGPEDPSLGARGAVVKVNLLSGKVVPVASGLLTATDLAVSPKGDIYVAQLFGPSIGVIKKGTSTVVPFREPVEQVVALEWSPKGLYATDHAFGPGRVVLFPF